MLLCNTRENEGGILHGFITGSLQEETDEKILVFGIR